MRGGAVAAMLLGLSACQLLLETGDPAETRAAVTVADGSAGGARDASAAGDAPVVAAITYRDVVMADKPVAYWRFEDVGGATAKDEIGKHDGSYRGATSVADGLEPNSHAVDLNGGAGAWVEIPGPDFRFAGQVPFSIEVWVKARSLAEWARVASNEYSAGATNGWWIGGNAGGLGLHLGFGNGIDGLRYVMIDGGIDATRFHHLVFTYDGAILTFFLDGERVAQDEQNAPAVDVGTLLWGCAPVVGTGPVRHINCMDGVIDEAAIYGGPISFDAVKRHYVAGTAK